MKNGIRPDGRTFDKTRSIMLNVKSIPNADGSAICKIGQTTVICGVKAVSNNVKEIISLTLRIPLGIM